MTDDSWNLLRNRIILVLQPLRGCQISLEQEEELRSIIDEYILPATYIDRKRKNSDLYKVLVGDKIQEDL